MKLKSGSASSFQKWLDCPAQWAAYYDTDEDMRTPELSGSAAMLGTSCHEALEAWVRDGHYQEVLSETARTGIMTDLYHKGYWDTFPAGDGSRYDEGLEMCLNWVDRQFWGNREVISTEERDSFDLPTSIGKITIKFVFDRLDRLTDEGIEVVDYKSWVRNMPPDELHDKLQARVYALAAQLKFPDAPYVDVTMDQLRYSTSTSTFSKEDSRETWAFLQQTAEDIIATQEAGETLCSTCRWCVRRNACETLRVHGKVGGPLAMSDIEEAVTRRHEIKLAMSGLYANLDDLDSFISQHGEREGMSEWLSDTGLNVSLRSKKTRSVDAELVSKHLGDDTAMFIQHYGGLGVPQITKALKDDSSFLSADRLSGLGELIRESFSGTKVFIK